MERFNRIFTKACDRLTLYLCGGIVLIMMLYVVANVFSRYALGLGGVTGCYSFVAALMVPLIYLALSYAWYTRGYIVVDVVQVRLKGKVLWGFQFAFLLVTLLGFALVIFYGTILETIEAYISHGTVGEPGYLIPQWPWKATIIIGVFLMAIRNILDIIRMVRTGEVVPMMER